MIDCCNLWALIQIFKSNKLELKVWNLFEIEIWNLIRELESRILEFNEKKFEFHLQSLSSRK
jgi:hypothetical protein